MFFYALFPILLFSRSVYLACIAIGILIVQQAIGNVASDDASHFFVYVFPPSRIADFIIGILLHRLFSETRPPAASWVTGFQAASLTIFAACVALKTMVPQYARYDLYYVPAMSLIIFSFAWQHGRLSQELSSRTFVFLGNASFSLYLIHQLVIRYGEYVRVNVLKATGSSIEILWALLYISLSILFSALLFYYFENWAKGRVLRLLSPWASRTARHA